MSEGFHDDVFPNRDAQMGAQVRRRANRLGSAGVKRSPSGGTAFEFRMKPHRSRQGLALTLTLTLALALALAPDLDRSRELRSKSKSKIKSKSRSKKQPAGLDSTTVPSDQVCGALLRRRYGDG